MRRNFLIGFILFSLLLVVVVQYYFNQNIFNYDSFRVRANLLIFCFSLILFLLFKEINLEAKGQAFRLIYLVLLGCFVVHYQVYFDFEFGNYNLFSRQYLINNSLIEKSLLIANAGFISM